MGTRWLCNIHKDGIESEIMTTVYGQFDGYPTGAGDNIKKAFEGRKLVNGIPGDRSKYVNGMGCAAALLVWSLKDGEAGGIYIYSPGTKDVWEDYVYELYSKNDELWMKLGGLFEGPVSDFDGKKIEANDV